MLNKGKILKDERTRQSLSLREAEQKIGVIFSNLSNLENGRKPLSDKRAIELLGRYGVPLEESKRRVAEMNIKIERFKLSKKDIMKDAVRTVTNPEHEDLLKVVNKEIFGREVFDNTPQNLIPLYDSFEDGFKNDSKPIDFYPIPHGIENPREKLFYVKMKGDSMTPTVNDSDEILILKNEKKLENNKLYVFEHKNEYYLKRYKIITKDIAQLISDNSIYPEIVLTDDKSKSYDCVGQVLSVQKSVA